MVSTLSTLPVTQLFPTKPTIANFPENPKTFILKQCKSIKNLKQVHAHLIKTRLIHHPSVAGPLLESAALRLPFSTIDYALSIFYNLDTSAYTIMIRGFTKFQSPEKSIILFRHMVEHSVQSDEFTFSGVLEACSKLTALKEGEQVHAHVLKSMGGFENMEFVETSLVYMFAWCGRLDLALQVFDGMSERSAVAWNSMLSGYVRYSYWEEDVGMFEEMLKLSGRVW